MVTREQRKVAEELERIREGLRMSRWNAGAKHKEAKRGERSKLMGWSGVETYTV